MVDVSAKETTVRRATARAEMIMHHKTAETIRSGGVAKGDVLSVARIAAIQATKCTSQIIPLCHVIPIEAVSVDFAWPVPGEEESDSRLICEVEVQTSAKTGVEMEAMTAASVACLTIYDMIKSKDRTAQVENIHLVKKSGGKTGDFCRPARTNG